LVGITLADIADLRHVGFDKLQPIPVDRPAPLADEIFDAAWSSADPLQLEMEDRAWVMDDVVVQDDGFCLVAFLTRAKFFQLAEVYEVMEEE